MRPTSCVRSPGPRFCALGGIGLVLALVVACSPATPSPSAPPGASAVASSPGPSATTPAPPGGASDAPASPDGSPASSPGDGATSPPAAHGTPPPPDAPLPAGSLTDPGAIGQALIDPNRVTDGVVSLVTLMGIEIDAADGSVVQPGSDQGAGRLAMTEAEVWGLAEMTREDLAAMADTGQGVVPLAQLFEALRPSLPPGYTLDDLVAGYADAYGRSPDALVPQVMLGMPVSPAFPLTRLQAWLLVIDGFLGPSPSARADPSVDAVLAASRTARLGTANPRLPPLTSRVPGLSDVEWAYLVARLPTLAWSIPFTTWPPASVHEGHGGPGRASTIVADVVLPPPLVFPQTGHVLLEPMSSPSGIRLQWNSAKEGTLTAHGTLSGRLRTPVTTNATGTISIGYTPRREVADGRGTVVQEQASLYAEADAADLVRNTYFTASSTGAIEAVLALCQGTVRSSRGTFPIEWHEPDAYQVTIRNKFDVVLGVGQPDLVDVHRVGLDTATGVLYKASDGTYRGTLDATVNGSMDGSSFVGDCHDHSDARQSLYVVGHPVRGGRAPPFVRLDGEYANQDLMLYFYPATAPAGSLGPCQGTMEFTGGGPDAQPAGTFLPFNDSRWTAALNTTNWQDGIGLQVLLPKLGTLDVTDNRQMRPDLKVESQWSLVITKQAAP